MRKNPRLWNKFIEKFPEFVATNNVYNSIANFIHVNIDSVHADSPNILLYSAIGFPLNLLWNHVATLKYGNIKNRECTSESNVVFLENQHFIDIDFAHPFNARNIDQVHELILQIVTTVCIISSRHLIVCRNIDRIDDIYSFRVLLERFSKNALFVCTTHSFSSIEGPLKSRFLCVRVPLLSKNDVQHIMQTLDPTLKDTVFDTRNVFRAIAAADAPSDVATLGTFNCQYIRDCFSTKNTIIQMRELASKIYTMNIPLRLIVEDVLHFVPDKRKANFVLQAANIEHMMKQTNEGRKPLYYEYLLIAALSSKT